jgi:glioma pathogenesis-related protein 2
MLYIISENYIMSTIHQPVLTSDHITEITNYVNAYRAKNQAPPLMWDTTIAQFSQQWSYYLLSKNEFRHSGNNLYGENLAYFQGYGSDAMGLIKKAIDLWYDEITLYDFNNPGFSHATGHFTCLVWKASTKFAMGISINTATNAVDVTMNTSPPGNYQGQYQENVLPLAPSPILPRVPTPKPLRKPKHIHLNIPYIIQKYPRMKLSADEPDAEMEFDCSLNSYDPVIHLSANAPPSINKQVLIRLLYNLLNQVQSNQPNIMAINSISEIIHYINNTNM